MKALSVTGLVLGVLAPLVMLFPVLGALAGDEGYLSVGCALLFVTVPAGIVLTFAAGILAIVAAGLALRRRTGPQAVPVIGIILVGIGLLVEPIAVLFAVTGAGEAAILAALVVGVASSLLGLLLCAISGLRTSRPARSDSPAESGVG